VALLKGLLSHRYGFQLTSDPVRLRSLVRKLVAEDPLAGMRRKRRGIRRRHLRKAWERSAAMRATGIAKLARWAAGVTAWHVLARGGELASVARSDLSFERDGKGHQYAVLWLRPLKKRAGQAQPKVPQYIAEQPGQEWEPYAALARLAHALDSAGHPRSDPLFRMGNGKGISTASVRAFARDVAQLVRIPEKQVGAHSFRIGGATDLASTGAASVLLLQAKGRWQSDIARIYARMTRRAHLAASRLMHAARGRDLEELLPDFVQPA
jgi:hypothetical protein